MWLYISSGICIVLILILLIMHQKMRALSRERDQFKGTLKTMELQLETPVCTDRTEIEEEKARHKAELENLKELHKKEVHELTCKLDAINTSVSVANKDRDIAEVSNQNIELENQSHWYEIIFDTVPFPMSVTDMQGKWIFINKSAEEILGVKRADVIGQPCSSGRLSICGTANCGVKCLQNGKPSTMLEEAGKKFRIDISCLQDQKNGEIGYMEVFLDKTFICDSRNEDMEFLDGLSQVVQSFVNAAKGIDDGAAELAGNSTGQASEITALSASISGIAAKTQANTALAGKSSELADVIKENAEKGSAKMDKLAQAVEDINASIQSISKVFRFIDDIAFQTNILALNAAVEAARAGQHGRGFAVVAEEVRNLAAKSAASAKDTGTLITDSMEKARMGVQIAGETSASFKEIVSGIDESSRIAKEILSSSEEQDKEIVKINGGIEQVTQGVQKSSAMAEESAAASAEMSRDIVRIRELVDTYSESLISFYDYNINEG